MSRRPSIVRWLLAVALTTLTVIACSEDTTVPDKSAGLSAPDTTGGKTDGTDGAITERGAIALNSDARAAFERDDQLDAWTFSARAGAQIRVESTLEGSSAELDTTLFLYGPRFEDGSWPAEPFVSDDDSGAEYHALLDAVTLPEEGDYRIVIGTYFGTDRGDYRITLDCLGDACEPEPVVIVEPPVGDAGVALSRDSITVGEARGEERLTLKLVGAPSAHVLVQLESSNPDEAVVYPQRVHFCTPGHVVAAKGCEPVAEVEGAVEPDPPHATREVEITVFGVADGVEDGDAAFTINLRVESEDPGYAALIPTPLPGTNLDDPAAVPDYSHLDGLADDALLSGLHAQIGGHVVYGYHGQNSARTLMFATVDVHDGQIEGLYDGTTTARPDDSIAAFQAGFNTEHTWPQGQFDKVDPMVSDLHHIFPVDIDTNSERSSFPFGVTAAQPDALRSLLGTDADGDTVYQVRPERRGDVARAHFYMAARYRPDATLPAPFDDDANLDNGCIQDSEEAVLRQWHVDDPVDATERARNARIEALQGNRNPFIDQPELVERISDF